MLRRLMLIALGLLVLVPLSLAYAQDPPAVINDVLADLGQRVGATVTLDDLEEWTWQQTSYPDASLGCAQPGQDYTQGTVNAYRFLLTYNGVAYDYRVPSAGGGLILCTGGAAAQPTGTPPPAATTPVGPNTPAAPGTATPPMTPPLTPGTPVTPGTSATQAPPAATVEAIEVCPGAPPSSLQVGAQAQVVQGIGTVLLWSAPTEASATVGEIPSGDLVTLLDGPQCVENQVWWRVEYDEMVGWIAEGAGNFSPVGVTAPAPAAATEEVAPAPGTVVPLALQQYDLPFDREAISLDNLDVLTSFRNLALDDEVTKIAWSPDGATIAVAAAQGIWLYDATNFNMPPRLIQIPNGPVYDAAFDTVTGLLATAHADGAVRLWDTAIGGQIAVLQGHTAPVRAVAFSPDGTLLASAGGEEDSGAGSEILLWDAATRAQIAALEGHGSRVTDLAFNADGSLLASSSADGTVRLWDAISATLATTFEGHEGAVNTVLFKPDGTWLASGGEDATVRLWEIGTDQQMVLEGHTGPVLTLVFGIDDNILASAGGPPTGDESDAALRLWDITSGEQVDALDDIGAGTDAAVRSLLLSPDGTTLAFATFDGTSSVIRLWGALAQ